MMRRLNPEMSDKEVKEMHRSMDKDLDGKVSFEEFHDWLTSDAQRGLAEKLLDKAATPAQCHLRHLQNMGYRWQWQAVTR